MTNSKGFLFLLLISFFSSAVLAQTTPTLNKKSYNYFKKKTDKKNTSTKKSQIYLNNQYSIKYATVGARKIVTSHKYVWVLSANGKRGYWAGATASDIKTRQEENPSFPYELSFGHIKPYKPDAQKPTKSMVLGRMKEYKDGLEKSVVKNFTIGKKEDLNKNKAFNRSYTKNSTQTIVSYIKKITLGILFFLPDVDHIVVTDTLFVPVAAPRKSTFTSLQTQKRNYIKIIANCIVYESPVQLLSSNRDKTDFVFTANKIIFKSTYKNLKKNELSPPPPFFKNDSNTKGYKDYLGEKERMLINRLFVYSMEQILTKLNTTSNSWRKDKLLAEFQTFRRQRVNTTLSSRDSRIKNLFNKLCVDFDAQYGKKRIVETRNEGTLKILVEGAVEDLPDSPFRYYALPTRASLLPVYNQSTGKPTALGFVTYNPTGEVKLELKMDIALSFDQKKVESVSETLKKNGLILNENFPTNLASIEEQPLKINGRTIGEIIPIGNQNVRFEIKLPDDGLSLLNLFLKPINFKIDYTITGYQQPYSQIISLAIAPFLLESLDPDQILESFSVIENSSLTHVIKISSKLKQSLENEGALNYVEVLLEFNFKTKTVFRGPYRFSSFGTLASEVTIPFLKHSNDYSIKVKGKAYYENGWRNIVPFETKDEIIVLDEGIFK